MKTDTSRREKVPNSGGLSVGRSLNHGRMDWALISFLLTLTLSISIVPIWAEEEEDEVNGLRHRVDRLEAQLAELQGTVSILEDPLKPEYVTVDCGEGQTVTEALAAAQGHLGPLYITVEGVCEEAVYISRDDVTLVGASEGDGLRSASPTDDVLSLSGARRIFLSQLTLSHGIDGIRASNGSSFQAFNLKIEENGLWGVLVEGGSSASLYDCVLENNAHAGIMSWSGGAVDLDSCTVTRNVRGLSTDDGGSIRLWNTNVTENETGIMVFVGSTVRVASSTIERNSKTGIDVLLGTANIRENSRVANNGQAGISVAAGSTVQVEQTIIEDNTGPGIAVANAATIGVFESSINGNGADGIHLTDLSHGSGGWGGVQIMDNNGWGIHCAGPPAIAPAQNGFSLAQFEFSGNAQGDTNCP